MKSPLHLIVLGTLASNPYAGMAWMHMQIAAGLKRLGHDIYYFEATSAWPYDPIRNVRVNDSSYAIPYLAKVCEQFGLADRWAYRRSYSDKEWLGMERSKAEDLLAHADAVLNIAGATRRAKEGLNVNRLVYFGTDPVFHEIGFANGERETVEIIEEHDDAVTYGENIGNSGCMIPPLPKLRAKTRQPVLLDYWHGGPPRKPEFTTIANWKQDGRDIHYGGETYYWSKDREFMKFIDLPLRTRQPLELATNLTDARSIRHGEKEVVKALGMEAVARSLLETNGWRLANSLDFTTDPWPYRDYIRSSRGEFTVARDLNVRLQSGWFSERSACYLAAGRPVVTQDTGFGRAIPVGEGVFAFTTIDDILSAFDKIASNYQKQSRAALAVAEEYFKAERVLDRLLVELGL